MIEAKCRKFMVRNTLHCIGIIGLYCSHFPYFTGKCTLMSMSCPTFEQAYKFLWYLVPVLYHPRSLYRPNF